jgi:hypothetical protein
MVTVVARNANEAMVRSSGVCIFRSLESDGRFRGGAFDRNLAPVAVRMFSRLIYVKDKLCKSCSFNAICKGIATIKCITAQHKKINSRQR